MFITQTNPTPLREQIGARKKLHLRASHEERWVYMASAVNRLVPKPFFSYSKTGFDPVELESLPAMSKLAFRAG